jgi:hypothetical protein
MRRPPVSSTAASSSTRTPPNVNVIPHVTGNAAYGGVSIASAQLDFGGVIPSVRRPSFTAGSNGRVELRDRAREPVRVDPQTHRELLQRVGVDARRARRLVVDRAQQRDRLGVEDLRGDALGLLEDPRAELRVGVVAEVLPLVEEALAAPVHDDPDGIGLA